MYLQIIEQIKQRVAAGDWQPGQEIPSIRGLAVELKVSVITVKRAYLELEHEGVIVTRQGRGSFVAENPELGNHILAQQLDQQLQAVVETARLLGIDGDALAKKLREARSNLETPA